MRLLADQTLMPMAEKNQTGSDSGKLHVSLARPNPEHMDDEFLATAYPKVHENLKLITDEHVIDDKPESHSGSISDSNVNSSSDCSLHRCLISIFQASLLSLLHQPATSYNNNNKNPANYHLYHALMEALIADEDVMDKEVKDKVKTHKRKHDSDNDEDDDDDEGPSAGLNQGKSTKRRRHYSGAFGSAQPPTKDDEQSSKKPRESDASASKQHPALTSTGWQITDTRDVVVDSSMHRSDPESEHSEQSSDDIPMQDEGHILDLEDIDNAHIPKVSTTTWFKPIPEVPTENKLQRKTYDIGSFIKWFCRRTGKKKLCKADLEGPAFNLVKAFHKNNQHLALTSTGWQITDTRDAVVDSSMHRSDPESEHFEQSSDDFPMQDEGHDSDMEDTNNAHIPKANTYATTYQVPAENRLQRKTHVIRSFIKWFCRRTGKKKLCKADLEGDKERKITLSISKLKAARYLDFVLEELVPSLWVESEREYDISAVYGITHWWFRRKEFYINKHSEPSDREAVRSRMQILIFQNHHPNDFEDLFLLNIQEKLNHLPKTDKTSLHTAVNMWIRNLVIRNRVGDLQLRIESYQTKINLECPNWDAADYYFKEDYTIVPKPRAIVYRDRNDQRKLMRLNELHKFSDGTLTRVMEKTGPMVKDFHLVS
ncbi:hypothetical protein Tco_0410072 [Tanacetum coccineum]